MKTILLYAAKKYGFLLLVLMLISYFAVNIMVKERDLLVATGRYGDPAMLWAKTELHRDVIKQSTFKMEKKRSAYGEPETYCVRPAWPVTVGRRDNDLRACDESEWRAFGNAVVIKNISKLTGNGGGETEKYSLVYMDKNAPILEPHRYTASIAFGGSNRNLTASQIVLQTGGGVCNVTLKNGLASKCVEDAVQTIKILNGKEGAEQSTAASLSISKEGVVSFKVRPGWSYSGGKDDEIESDKSVELACTAPVESINNRSVKRMVMLKDTQHNMLIWCANDAKVPASELGRLAALVQQTRAEKGVPPEIVTTFSSAVDQRLREIVGRIGCTGQCDAQVTMMDAFSGNVRGLVSNKASSDVPAASAGATRPKTDELMIDNFLSQSPGSIAKLVFSQAILSTVPELHTLRMFNFNRDRCRLLDVKLGDSCTAEAAASAPGYNVWSHTKTASMDFPEFIAQSENVYATSLLFLGSTVPADDGGCRADQTTAVARGWSRVASPSAYGENATIVPLGQSAPLTYLKWMKDRVALFNEGVKIKGKVMTKCSSDVLPPWHYYMVKKMNVFNKENNNVRYRSYIWGADLKEKFADMEKLSPEREFIGFGADELNTSFYDKAYKWVYGGGDYKWSNLSIAEQVSSIVAKRHIMANVVKANERQEFERFEKNEILAADQILKGMKLVISNGTAKSLCPDKVNGRAGTTIHCPSGAGTTHQAAFIKHPVYGDLELLAKTGTPSKVTSTTSNGEWGLWEIIEKVQNSSQSKKFDSSWCGAKESVRIGSAAIKILNKFPPKESICKLQGRDVLDIIDRIYTEISLSKQTRKVRWDKTYVSSEYRRWLTAQLDLSSVIRESELDAKPKGFQEGNADSKNGGEKRVVFVVAQSMSGTVPNSYKHACTFMMSTNEEAGAKHMVFVKKLIDDIVIDANNLLLNSCGFKVASQVGDR